MGGPRPTGTASTVTAAATSNAGDAVRVPANLKCPVRGDRFIRIGHKLPLSGLAASGSAGTCLFVERESFSIKTCPVKATLA